MQLSMLLGALSKRLASSSSTRMAADQGCGFASIRKRGDDERTTIVPEVASFYGTNPILLRRNRAPFYARPPRPRKKGAPAGVSPWRTDYNKNGNLRTLPVVLLAFGTVGRGRIVQHRWASRRASFCSVRKCGGPAGRQSTALRWPI